MESSTNTDAALSLFDTTGQSTFALAEKENQIERLKRQVRVLESENAEFASSQPRLRNALGKDCTAEMVKLDKELLLAKEQCERWRNDFDEMSKKYEKFEKATIEQIDKRDKQIEQFRDQAMEMEEENGKLREMLQDEKSRVWRMHQEEFGSQVATPKAQIFADVLSADPAQNVGVPGNDEMVGDFDVNDADQIATNLLMILETLDKKQHDSTKIQDDIFAFLTAQGINSNNPEKFAAFSSIYKKVIDKRLAEIRTGNEQLRSNLSLGDKDLEACMKHLTVQDSITLSSMPSFAGLSKEIALQMEFSMSETEHNVTVGSMAAVNLANRTSNLVEACVRMFDKLRGSAEFFQNLLKTFGVTAEELGEDIVGKIEAMKLDMNNSVGEAQNILTEVKDAEKNWRSILHDQSQAAVSFNSTVNTSTRNESKQEQQLSGIALETEEIAELKMSLDNERTEKETLKVRVAGLEELIAQKGAENDRILIKIQELELKPCEKCAELSDLYETTKAKLDGELATMVELRQRIEAQVQSSKVLQDELERISSAELKKTLVEHSRTELNQIFDTMSFAKSRCSSVVGGSQASKRGKDGKKQAKQADQKK
ncbi:hypothetical protein GPALN_011401 [Globodera pallida]|nr:hypothetical protein GPALN_011401 [Globodera pallida]